MEGSRQGAVGLQLWLRCAQGAPGPALGAAGSADLHPLKAQSNQQEETNPVFHCPQKKNPMVKQKDMWNKQ